MGDGPSAEELSRLHARSFRGDALWSPTAFAHALNDPRFFLLHLPWPPATVGRAEVRSPGGFLLGRVAADEAEMLTLAVQPALRRRGMGRRLVEGFEEAARMRGGRVGFLEVADDNDAARTLYAALGWREAGRRPGYYRGEPGPGGRAAGTDAVLMRKPLA
jgi:ribosomal-protein-alanine N-acetyltransferase